MIVPKSTTKHNMKQKQKVILPYIGQDQRFPRLYSLKGIIHL